MSRVGKLAVSVPGDVQVSIDSANVTVKGKLGELSKKFTDSVSITQEGSEVNVSPVNDTKQARALWGTTRSIIFNMVTGVTEGFTVRLEINGVGFKASLKGKWLVLSLGFSHDIIYAIPSDIDIVCEKPTLMVIKGVDKQKVGSVAGDLIKLRRVEPYKGKGVYKEGSYIRRKEGKKK